MTQPSSSARARLDHEPEVGTGLRIMIVDDSAVIRGFITSMLKTDPRLEVIASCSNGAMAVQMVARAAPDVVILDIEMPVMDGITALPKLLAEKPQLAVIIASTLSQRGAEISLRAIEMGAADYVPKPVAAQLGSSDAFRRELIDKILLHGSRSQKKLRDRGAESPAISGAVARRASPPVFPLRVPSAIRPEILAIGSSTGGPQALNALLRDIPRSIGVPIVITQHMPPAFTAVLAQHIEKASGWPSHEAIDGETLAAGTIYVAPGDHHLIVERSGRNAIARLNKDPAENYCRPAVDPMLRSIAEIFGPRALTVILTGMGADGLAGGTKIVAAGGTLMAQDEASSVVWGMPGAVAKAGLCSAVLPLGEIARHINQFFQRGLK